MRRARVPVAVLALALAAAFAPRLAAWGFPAHKHIADRMIGLLPPELTPLFEARRAFIVERAVDPDLWRNVGWEAEPPNHFLDLDFEAYGAYPFDALPREYDRAVQKFGLETVHSQGTLPWRTAEFYGRLQRAFESLKRPSPSPYALDDIVLFSAVLCHYVADGHVPFHAVTNYDGQLTGQAGLHSRFESDPRGEMFRILLESNRLTDRVLAADKAAAAGRQFYDDGYFEAFRVEALPIVDQRVSDAIAATAAFITGAWEQAGKPAVPVVLTRGPRRIPPPAPPK